MPSTVTVHYPFHPLHNRCLNVVAWPRQATNAVTVRHPDGKTLKIPFWMLQPDAARFCFSEHIELAASALLALAETLHSCAMVATTNPPEQIAPYAPLEIKRTDLDSEPVLGILKRLKATGKLLLEGDALASQRSLFDDNQ